MERRDVLLGGTAFLASLALGFSAGVLLDSSESPSPEKFVSDVEFEANSSNVIQDVSFDNRTVQLIVQPGNESEFFLSINGTVEKISPVERDGEVHDLRKIFTVGDEMYIFHFQYSDDPESSEDWIRVQRIEQL